MQAAAASLPSRANPMIQKSTVVLALTTVIVAGAIGYAALRQPSPPAAAVPAIAQDASVGPAASPPIPTRASPTPPGVANHALPPEHEPEDGMDADELMLRGIQKLDASFQAEPIAPRWAAEQEQMITASFSPAALKAAAAPAPVSSAASCRSQTCRITATYKTELDAQVAQLNLLTAISPALPHAIMGEVPGADGSVQLVDKATPDKGGPRPNAPRN
jgi:hypothetical protein